MLFTKSYGIHISNTYQYIRNRKQIVCYIYYVTGESEVHWCDTKRFRTASYRNAVCRKITFHLDKKSVYLKWNRDSFVPKLRYMSRNRRHFRHPSLLLILVAGKSVLLPELDYASPGVALASWIDWLQSTFAHRPQATNTISENYYWDFEIR